TKSGPATGSRGANVVYTLVVTNRGPSDADSVLITDPTPVGLTLVGLTGACTVAPGCFLAVGASQTATATFGIPPDYAGHDPIINAAGVLSSTVIEGNSRDNQALARTSLSSPVADLSIVKTNNATQVTAGLPTTYTITVTNAGPASAIGTTVVDQFDPTVFGSVQWQCSA